MTIEVVKGALVEKASATGEIVPRHRIAVKSKISGIVKEVFVEEGEFVRKGNPLLEISPVPTPLEYARSKRKLEMQVLALERRQVDLQRLKKLFEREMVSQADLDKVHEAYELALLERKLAEEEFALLDKGKVTVSDRPVESVIPSPVDSHVLRRHVHVGDPIVPLTSYQPGTELLTLADMNDLLLEGEVEEVNAGKIREGMEVDIKIGALPDLLVSGKLSKIALQGHKRDEASVFGIEVSDLETAANAQLRAGYSATADIVVEQAVDVPIIPERLVKFRGDSTFVFLLPAGETTPKEHPVELGISDGINVEITSGLEVGDLIVEQEVQ